MKKEYLQKFVVKVSDIIHLAVQFNVVLIVVKIKNMFAQKCDIGLHIDSFKSYHENVNQ